MSVIAATTSGATVTPSWAANRAARSIRSGSSENESCGVPGVRSSPWARSTTPPYGSSTTRPGSRTAIALTVKSRRAEVALEGVAEVDRRLARGGVVGLGAVRRHLDHPRPLAAADGAEVAAHVPGRLAPRREQPLGLVGARRGREVEVGVRPAEHRVADRPADQRQLVAGRRRTAPRARRSPARSAPARRPRCAGARPRCGRLARVRTRGSTLGRQAVPQGRGAQARGLTSTHAPPALVQCCPGGAGGPGAGDGLVAGRAAADPGGTPGDARRAADPAVQAELRKAEPTKPARSGVVSRRAKRQAKVRADTDTPLAVTIDQLTPSTIPEKGLVRVSGTVTNNDTVPWTHDQRLRLHLRGADDLVGAARGGGRHPRRRGRRRPDHRRGPQGPDRRAGAGRARGRTASAFRAGCCRPAARASTGSACTPWARARTAATRPPTAGPAPSCRWSPPPATGALPTAVVIPLRHQLVYADDGSVDDLAAWTKTLSPGGRLRSLVDFGASSGDRSGDLGGRPGAGRRRTPARRGQPAAARWHPTSRAVRTTARTRRPPDPSATPSEEPTETPSPAAEPDEDHREPARPGRARPGRAGGGRGRPGLAGPARRGDAPRGPGDDAAVRRHRRRRAPRCTSPQLYQRAVARARHHAPRLRRDHDAGAVVAERLPQRGGHPGRGPGLDDPGHRRDVRLAGPAAGRHRGPRRRGHLDRRRGGRSRPGQPDRPDRDAAAAAVRGGGPVPARRRDPADDGGAARLEPRRGGETFFGGLDVPGST